MIQGNHWIAARPIAVNGAVVDHSYVEFAVIVAVKKRDPSTAHRFDDVMTIRG
jgi:hypothetical protein